MSIYISGSFVFVQFGRAIGPYVEHYKYVMSKLGISGFGKPLVNVNAHETAFFEGRIAFETCGDVIWSESR